MKTRNLIRNPHGTIDMEIEHPVYGWIPFTASPDDPEEHGRTLYVEAESGALGTVSNPDWPIIPRVPAEPTTTEIVQAIAARDAGDKLAWETISARIGARKDALAECAVCSKERTAIRANARSEVVYDSTVKIAHKE